MEKKMLKLFLFADYLILSLKMPKTTKKLLGY
jgi:hypothetical protein